MDRFINIKQRFRSLGRNGSRKSKRIAEQQERLRQEQQQQQNLAGQQDEQNQDDVSQDAVDESRRARALSAPVKPLPTLCRTDAAPEQPIRPHTSNSGDTMQGIEQATPFQPEQQVQTESLMEAEATLPDVEATEEPPPTPGQQYEAEQVIRDTLYVTSEGEDPADYTAGPARIICAHDGILHCPALLLTYDFSQATQTAVRTERDFARAQRIATRRLEVATNFELDIECEIANHQSRITSLAEQENVGEQIAALQSEIAALEAMHQNSITEREIIRAGLDSQATYLREVQSQMSAYLEQAFVVGALLEPEEERPDTAIPDLDLQEKYRLFQESQHQDGDVAAFVPLDTNIEHLQAPPLSAEEQAVQDLRDAYWTAHERLQYARAAFDSRADTRAFEEHEREKMLQHGEPVEDATIEEFDKRWFMRNHELTREVIDAEAALREAKIAMLDARIDFQVDDLQSGFGDRGSNGYPMQHEQAMIDSAPRPKITQWLDALPEKAGTPLKDEFNGDEWETETRSVGIDDSASAVPEDPVHKERIAKWRRLCGLE
ncbi:hypothetical protein LTR86_008056 [Recurvomyces mirabilis]|nr:hypothetical protein LTR86_008056 [Recurvomyces mirabilis]